MKSFIVFALFVAVAVALPTGDKEAVILKQDSTNIGTGPYEAVYETSNGIAASEQGTLKNVGTENEAAEVRGQYSYIGDDGLQYLVTYIANELGFQPQGAHIPKA